MFSQFRIHAGILPLVTKISAGQTGKKTIPRTLLCSGLFLSAAHFIVLMTAILASLTALSGFDNPSGETPWFEAAGTTLVNILGFPALYIWEQFQLGSRLPDIVEWLTVAANSLLWGFTLAFFFVTKNISGKSG